MIKSGSDKWDERISWALMYSFIAPTLNYVIKSVLPVMGSLWSLLSIILALSVLLVYALIWGELWRRSSPILLKSITVFGIIYFISYLMSAIRNDPVDLVTETARTTFLFYIPAGVLAVSVNNKKILYSVIVKASFILSALMLFRLFANYNPLYADDEQYEYSMSFGYILIAPTLLHLNEYIRIRKRLYLLLFLFEFICIIVYASRGVLLSVAAFVLYVSLIEMKRGFKKFFAITLLLLGTFYFMIEGDSIIGGAVGLLGEQGIESRTLNMMVANNIDDDSGRNNLFRISWEMIEQKPIFGWGVGGECYYFARHISTNEVPSVACTSHNGILQAMVQLGVLGGLFLTFLVVRPIFGARKIKNIYVRNLVVIYFCAFGIPTLTISSGFLTQSYIAIYAYLYYLCRKEKAQIE